MQAIYRKYRPDTFDKVYGQKHITDILKIKSKRKIFLTHIFFPVQGERVRLVVPKFLQELSTVWIYKMEILVTNVKIA